MKLHLKRRFRNALKAFHPFELNRGLAIVDADGFRVALRTGTADEKVIKHSFDNDIFFTAVPDYQPGPHDVIMDVGAHIGTFSLLAARKVPNGTVFAIEASEETFHYLNINIALNRMDNIRASHLALTDRDGTVKLYHDRENWGHSIMAAPTTRSEMTPAQSLAGFMASNAIERCNFIKFNCEGAEFPILMAAPDETLSRIERMLILVHPNFMDGYSLDGLVAKLQSAGFSPTILPKTGWLYAFR